MKKIFITALLSVFSLIVLEIFSAEIEKHPDKLSVPSGPYMGQESPGKLPVIFAPDIVSTGLFEMNAAFSPNGKEFYYSIADPFQNFNAILCMRIDNGKWSSPQVAHFSGKFSDFDPVFSPDGKRLFFISRRPLEGISESKKDTDIWMIDWNKSGSSEPMRLPYPINSDSDEYYASVSNEGTLYFTSTREGGKGSWDIYKAKQVGGEYSAIENLEESINSKYNEHDPFIAPDESYMIFTSNRPGGYGRGDLYISFRNADGSWTPAKNLGKEINSPDYEYCPSISPDGKYLFFSRFGGGMEKFESDITRTYQDLIKLFSSLNNGLGNVYWVEFNTAEISNESDGK